MSDPRQEIASAAAQSTPSITAVLMWITGHDLNYWVGIAGLVFIILQAAYLLWKWRRDIRRDREHIEERLSRL